MRNRVFHGLSGTARCTVGDVVPIETRLATDCFFCFVLFLSMTVFLLFVSLAGIDNMFVTDFRLNDFFYQDFGPTTHG